MAFAMQHLNGDRLCAIDIETTGTDCTKHDIIQICILPLTGLIKPDPESMPFIMDLIPRRVENIEEAAMKVHKKKLCDIMQRGCEYYFAADLFMEWFDRLKMPPGKRIQPLACNWVFEYGFLKDWLGPATFDLCFDARYRDVMTAAIYCNDRANWRHEHYPYPKVNLEYLALKHNVLRTMKHDAIDDARVTAEVYRLQVQQFQW